MENNKSPMFLHALESFEHGLEHYLDGTERSRKFSLLHLDQAVELLLKEKIVRSGKTIYKSDGRTLSIHESLNSLTKTTNIPERPRLEEVHDLRNTVQHKGMTPDPASTEFYVSVLYSFVKRFLSQELETSIEDTIDQRYRSLIEGVPLQETGEIEEAFLKSKDAPTPSAQILAGYAVIQMAVNYLSAPEKGISGFRKTLKFAASENNHSPQELKLYINTIMRLRHEIVHSDYEATESDYKEFNDAITSIFKLTGVFK